MQLSSHIADFLCCIIIFFFFRMEQILKDCRIPLLWNANGSIEVIQHDDISMEEAEKVIKIIEGEYSFDEPLPKSCAPSPNPSVDLSSEAEYQERMSLLADEKLPHNGISMKEIAYCFKTQKIVPAASRPRQHKEYNRFHQLPQQHQERIYSCPICAKRFSRKFNLNTHIKCVHSDEKDYICPFCQRAFNHSSNLRKHIKTVHGEEKRMPCPQCKKPFKHTEALKSHLKVIHGINSH